MISKIFRAQGKSVCGAASRSCSIDSHLQQRLGPPDLLRCRVCVHRRLVEDVVLQEARAVDAVTRKRHTGSSERKFTKYLEYLA